MTKSKTRKTLAAGVGILCAAAMILIFAVRVICSSLGLYDTMVGKSGLQNVIVAVCLSSFSALLISLPIFILGVMAVRGIYKRRNDMKSFILPMIGVSFITISVPLILFGGFNRTRYSEQQYITDKSGIFGDLRILSDCISDYFSDEYNEYTVDELLLDYSRELSMTGKGGGSYHYEYVMSGYYNNDFRQLFKAQIGRDDYDLFKESLPKGFDTTVTVYKKSGFIRSVEPSVDFNREQSYEHLFVISNENGVITRSELLGNTDIGDIMWCGFDSGKSGDVRNSLCGINAMNSLEYPYSMNYDEMCLYGWVDGGYKRVSNIIYSEENAK